MSTAVLSRRPKATSKRPIHKLTIDSPLGALFAAATDTGICFLEFANDRPDVDIRFELQNLFGGEVDSDPNEHLSKLDSELAGYFAGELKQFSVPLELTGTPFQKRVWNELLRIPYGETRSYEEIAVSIGQPKA